MKYTLVNRKKSTLAKSNEEFVTWMRKSDLQSFENNHDFMEAYSHRKSTFENIELRFATEDEFVEDLQKNDMLKIETPERKWGIF
ncbi:hypothetical protein [Chryseobacterium taklimakanense]|uniref:hypothetical protein n=1 Tax=Chryseobacterium taklimakanense TaxID=536441 RepID=UPI0023F70CD3|nr:hypothetical protein [Chryseobacterium taklimakanense]